MSLYVDIKKTFPDFKLDVQFEGENEVLALLGASGCGKSLILKCIAGIERPDSGRIVINNQVVFDSEKGINLSPQKRYVGFLFQNYALFPTKTVWNNISSVIKKPKSERQAIVEDIVQKFQLDGVKNLYPRQISGGQQQRTALARILVSQPKILMLDEPFSALDTQLKWRMEQEVAAVLKEFEGMTILVSHDRDEVYRISDKIAVMDNGKIDSVGTKSQIFQSPNTLTAALMTGCKNVSRVEKVNDRLIKALDWGIMLRTKNMVSDNIRHLGVRANHFKFVYNPNENNNCFLCHIHAIIEEPFENTIVFSFNGSDERLQLKLQKQLSEKLNGKEFTIHVPLDKIIFLE